MQLANRVIAQDLGTPTFSLDAAKVSLERTIAKNWRQEQIKAIEAQLPDFLFLFSIAIRNGLSPMSAWLYLAERTSGELASNLQNISTNLDLGADFSEELDNFAKHFPSQAIESMVQTLISNLETGASVSGSLFDQSASIRELNDRRLMKQAARNETKMLVPTIFLILPVTILFAIFPSLAMLTNAI